MRWDHVLREQIAVLRQLWGEARGPVGRPRSRARMLLTFSAMIGGVAGIAVFFFVLAINLRWI